MWLCRPTRRRPSALSTRRAASAASPAAREKPNFWSSCAVAMNSWVCASTPTVTRMSTDWRTPRSLAIWSSRAISWNESSTTVPMPASTALTSSATDLLLPWKVIRSGGKSAASATASSPPLHTSRLRPSWAIQRAISTLRNALAA